VDRAEIANSSRQACSIDLRTPHRLRQGSPDTVERANFRDPIEPSAVRFTER